MKKATTFAFTLALAALAGCASAPSMTPPPDKVLSRPLNEAGATVIVFRESAMAARFVGLTVGVNGKPFANLDNEEKLRVTLPANEEQKVFVQARQAKPTELKLTLEPGAVVCLHTQADADAFVKALVPLALMQSGYGFSLKQVPCPSDSDLASYKEVPVNYRK